MNRRLRRQQKKQGRRSMRAKGLLSSDDVIALLNGALADLDAGAAAKAYEASVRVLGDFPDNDDAVRIAAHAAFRMTSIEQSVDAMRRLVSLMPGDASLGNDLGGLLCHEGAFDEAESVLRQALGLDPVNAEIHANLGQALMGLKRPNEAELVFRQAIAANDRLAAAENGLGSALEAQDCLDDAVECYRRAVDLDPESLAARKNFEKALIATGAGFDERERLCRRDLEAAPGDNGLSIKLAGILRDTDRINEARKLISAVLDVAPDTPQAREMLSEIQFLDGDFKAAFENYEARLAGPWIHIRPHAQPLWRGEALRGKTILVWGEQGIGDELMFASLLPVLRDAGANVIVECDPRLVVVFARSFPWLICVPSEDEPSPLTRASDIDFQVPIGSLGRFLWEEFQATTRRPYLCADPVRAEDLRETYQNGDDVKLIGVAWRSINPSIGPHKSTDLDTLAPLLSLPGVRGVDLQYGETEIERAVLEETTGIHLVHDENIDQWHDLDGFAAQIAALDMVISVSNTTVHFAAGLGIPTWVLLSTVPMWRWGSDHSASPWYPGLRLFRQSQLGDWPGVINEVCEAFRAS